MLWKAGNIGSSFWMKMLASYRTIQWVMFFEKKNTFNFFRWIRYYKSKRLGHIFPNQLFTTRKNTSPTFAFLLLIDRNYKGGVNRWDSRYNDTTVIHFYRTENPFVFNMGTFVRLQSFFFIVYFASLAKRRQHEYEYIYNNCVLIPQYVTM